MSAESEKITEERDDLRKMNQDYEQNIEILKAKLEEFLKNNEKKEEVKE